MLRSYEFRQRRAFTLVELLVVIAIIGVLIGLLLPAVQMVREAGRRLKCENNLKQLALACHLHHDAHHYLPPGGTFNPPGDTDYNQGGWHVYILPFMEQENLFRQIPNLGVPYRNAVQDAIAAGIVPPKLPCLRCPSDPYAIDAPLTNYTGSQGPQCWRGKCGAANDPNQKYCNGTSDDPPQPLSLYPGYAASPNAGKTLDASQVRGMFGTWGPRINFASATDGTSNTLLLGEYLPRENPSRNGHWALAGPGRAFTTIIPLNRHTNYFDADGCIAAPESYFNNANVSDGYRSWHHRGVNFTFADGSVRFLSQTIDHRTYQYLGCRNDRQVVNVP